MASRYTSGRLSTAFSQNLSGCLVAGECSRCRGLWHYKKAWRSRCCVFHRFVCIRGQALKVVCEDALIWTTHRSWSQLTEHHCRPIKTRIGRATESGCLWSAWRMSYWKLRLFALSLAPCTGDYFRNPCYSCKRLSPQLFQGDFRHLNFACRPSSIAYGS